MVVRVKGELEALLTHSAAEQGRHPDDLVQDVLARHFEEGSSGSSNNGHPLVGARRGRPGAHL
jgi:hypothetical protein